MAVSGCLDPAVSKIICGAYSFNGQNHGKPVYRKDEEFENGLHVMLYYWHDRTDPSFSGWWFGPKVGGDQVWAFHPQRSDDLPPTAGWRCPFDGPVDASIAVKPEAARPAEAEKKPAAAPKRRWGQRPVEEASPAQAKEPSKRWAQRSASASDESLAVEGNRFQREALKQQREDDERRRREQQAVQEVRMVAHKLRAVKPETLIVLVAELEHVFTKHEDVAGSQKVALRHEVDTAIANARQRVEQIKQDLRKEEEKKKQAEQQKREQEEAQNQLVAKLSSMVDSVESESDRLNDLLSELSKAIEMNKEEASEFHKKTAEKARTARTAHESCIDLITSNRSTFEKAESVAEKEALKEVETRIATLLVRANRAASARNATVEAVERSLTECVKRLARRAATEMYMEQQRGVFQKYDKDDDGFLSRGEIGEYAQSECCFTVPDAGLDRICREPLFEDEQGVPLTAFHDLKVAVGIERELARDAKRRQRREERSRQLEERRDAWMQDLSQIAPRFEAIEEKVGALFLEVKRLADDSSNMSIEEMTRRAEEAREKVSALQSAEGEMADVRKTTDSLSVDKLDAELRSFLGPKSAGHTEAKKQSLRLDHLDLMLGRVSVAVKVFIEKIPEEAARREEAARAAAEEAERVIAARASAQKDTEEQQLLLNKYDSDGDGLLSRCEVLDFAKGEYGLEISQAGLERIFQRGLVQDNLGFPCRGKACHHLKIAVGIERELVRDAERRAEAERHRRWLQQRRETWPGEVSKVAAAVKGLDAQLAAVVVKIERLPDFNSDAPTSDIIKRAEEVNAALKPLEVEAAAVHLSAGTIAPDRQDPGLLEFPGMEQLSAEASGLITHADKLIARIKHISARQASFYSRACTRSREETDPGFIAKRITDVLRKHVDSIEQECDEIFLGLRCNSEDGFSCDDFVTFLRSRWGDSFFPKDAVVRWVNEHLGSGPDAFTCQALLERALRVCYRALRPAVMTEGGQVLRRLEVDEVIELCARPRRDGGSGVARIRGRAVGDGTVGSITVQGNDGTRFLGGRTVAVREGVLGAKPCQA